MTWEGLFYVQMYGGYVESLGIIHDCQCIAAGRLSFSIQEIGIVVDFGGRGKFQQMLL